MKLGLGTEGGVRTSGAWGKDVLVKVHGGGGKDVHWLVLTKELERDQREMKGEREQSITGWE